MTGYVHSYESLAAVDGDGVRYAVFLSGCPLRCIYCHNPDTWKTGGTEVTPHELVKKVLRYKPYFKNDGGITFSGGEPLLQAEFIEEAIPLLKDAGIGYVIDTSGAIPLTDSIRTVLIHADSVLLDLKFWDSDSYKKFANANFENVIETLEYLSSTGIKTIIRTVIVPGINDSEEILDKYISIIKNFSCVSKYELLAFHTMGFFKYEQLGIENPLADCNALSGEQKAELQQYVNNQLKNGC